VQQDVGRAVIGQDEAESLADVEPLDPPGYPKDLQIGRVVGRVGATRRSLGLAMPLAERMETNSSDMPPPPESQR
jgi:hypothetical protein